MHENRLPRIHMKYQDLFSLNIIEEFSLSPATFLLDILRV